MDQTQQTSSTTIETASGRNRGWGILFALAGAGLLVYSQFFCFLPAEGWVDLPRLVVSRITGMAALAAGLLFLLQDGILPWFARPEQSPAAASENRRLSRAHIWAIAGAMVCAVLASLLAGKDWKAVSPLGSALAWLAGIALVAWAGWQGSFTRERAPRWVWIVGADILIAALVLRLISLQFIPVIFTGDESGFGIAALQILRGETTNLFSAPYMGGTNLPYLYDLIQAGALALFGRTAWAFRVTSALAGALTVLAVYVFGLRWFGRRTAIFAALTLAGNHLHLHFSRYAISNVFDGLFFVLVIGLLWDAWESGERKKYLLAGLALGFSQFFYTSARALPVAAVAFFMAALVFERRRFRAALVSIAIFWAAFLAVFLPMIVYYIREPYTFIAPWSRVGQDAVRDEGLLSAFAPAHIAATLEQVYRGLLGFTVLKLQWLYKPNAAILRALPALLFLVGAAAVLARRRWSQILLLGLWLAAFGFIGGLSDSTPAAQRYVAAVPALALIAGYGLASALDLWQKYIPARAWIGLGLALVIALWAGADDARFYFLKYTPEERYSDPNGLGVQRLAEYLNGKDASTEVVFVGYPSMEYTSIPTPEFFNPQITRVVNIHNPAELNSALAQPAGRRVYFFAAGHKDDLQRVQQASPGGRLTSEQNRWDEAVYWIYETGS